MQTLAIDFNVDDSEKSLEQLLRVLGRGTELRNGTVAFNQDLEMDFTHCQFIGPVGVVTLGLLRRTSESQGHSLTLRKPVLEKLDHYCSYSGLYQDFGMGGAPDSSHPKNVTRPLREFREFVPQDEIGSIVELVMKTMSLSRTGKTDLQLTLFEVARNVIDHSQSKVGAVLSARLYSEKRQVRFAIADAGIGFRGTLASRFGPADDSSALRLVFREGKSSRSMPHNLGQGLAHLSRLIEVTDGELLVQSGSAYLYRRGKNEKIAKSAVSFPGTIVWVKLPIRDDDEHDEGTESFWDG